MLSDLVADLPAAAAAGSTCAGFPRYTIPAPQHRADVLLSISAFEGSEYLRELTENALNHTAPSTVIVLHLNRASRYRAGPRGGDPHFDWLWNHPRVLINCLRLDVERKSGSLLQSQLANVLWANAVGLSPRFVVFQASNMWWVRRGMESYVHKHRQSLPCIRTPAACLRAHLDPFRHAYQGCAAVDALSPRDCNLVDDMPSPCIIPSKPSVRYIVATKHEGSFYPFRSLLAAMATLNSSLFDTSKRAAPEARGTSPLALWKDRCCRPESTIESSLFETKGCLEETVLQTILTNEQDNQCNDAKGRSSGDVLCRHYTEVAMGQGDLRTWARGVEARTTYGDEHLRFQVPWLLSDAEEDKLKARLGRNKLSEEDVLVDIEANCTWLRQQAIGAHAIKAHRLRTHAELRRALSRCTFPPLVPERDDKYN